MVTDCQYKDTVLCYLLFAFVLSPLSDYLLVVLMVAKRATPKKKSSAVAKNDTPKSSAVAKNVNPKPIAQKTSAVAKIAIPKTAVAAPSPPRTPTPLKRSYQNAGFDFAPSEAQLDLIMIMYALFNIYCKPSIAFNYFFYISIAQV